MAFSGLIGAVMKFFGGSAGRAAAGSVITDAAVNSPSNADEELNNYVNKKLEYAEAGLRQSVHEGAAIVREEIVRAIRETNSIASGRLLESVSVSGMTGSTEQPSITVGSSSFYAQFVEEGVKPGGKQPPSDRIMEWMVSKGMEPSESGAYLIGRKIKEQGIEGKYPFRTGIERARPLVDQRARIIIEKSLEKE
jgi:hypothetical protein